ncbi:MAG: MASE3 domain-containing protein [Methylobacter sp.]|nr:MASE3 domain-containing protein [Methylobacter sp.]MDP2099815.1 MASE3 domain-containing protein [Methylobacter sp.]MDP2427790.1 MASE3 domain-containing protein [Methylobacter sp.]MDP3055003.1 MASE3 domain-containing protein [Methylobacter sp.]MDP3361821.1 MASE3 domain-containing protein [Methylobacter sp.]
MDKRIAPFLLNRLAADNRYYLLLAALAIVALLFCLTPGAYFVVAAEDYLALHTLLEFSSIWVAFMVFGVTWHSLSSNSSASITVLGCAMLASGLLDFGHTLSYTGMPDFVTPSSPEKGIAFWLAARLTVALGLCAVSFMSNAPLRKPSIRYVLLFGFAVYTLSVYWVLLFHQAMLPRTFIEGQGLTGFKVAFEWGIVAVLALAAIRFKHLACSPDTYGLKTYFFAAAMIFIMSELFFTQYKSTSDAFNVLGHLYKIIGYFLLYRAVFVSTIQAPYHEVGRQQIRYRQLFDNMTSCGVVYQAVDNGRDFVVLEINHATERTEKISRDDVIGRRLTGLFPRAVDCGLLEVLNRVWRTGEAEQFPLIYYADKRISGWRENYLYRLADGNVVAVYDDITERKLTQQALQESEKNFRVMFETAAIGMAEALPESGQFLRVNLKFCQMTGYSEEELLATTFSAITHPDDRDEDMKGWLRMACGEVPEYVVEKRYIHKAGHEVWVHLNVVALRDESGKIFCTLAAVADITERRQAETDRRRYDRELKAIFNALPDFYFRLDAEGTILSYHANPKAMSELSGQPEQFIGQCVVDVLPPAQAALFAAKLKEQRSSNGRIITFEYPLTVADGERYYEARLANLADSGDIIVLVRDVAERKQLERQLQQAQKMEALGQLTGGIAHDFNNILAAILGYSNLALERCVTDPSDKLARYLGEVISASERARDLIAKMLAYSRTSAVVANVPLDMVAEVEKAVAMLTVAIPAGIEVVARLEPDVPSVCIDPIDVQQILINLAVNSRDAIGEQGRIDITLERIRVKRKTCAICHVAIDGDYVALEVKDSGAGIPANVQQRIFDPFFTTKEVGKGSGLGLSMVHGVVIKNNAHVLLETGVGQGTSFRLLFPFAEAEAVTATAPVSVSAVCMTERQRIWVVEDQESLAAYYLELFQEQGYRVSVFTDPTRALHDFRLSPDSVDLLVTDQTMPHLSGAELAFAMLALRPKLPIILVTGYSERINDEEAKRLGIRHYLNKPVDGKKLLDIVAAELNNIA